MKSVSHACCVTTYSSLAAMITPDTFTNIEQTFLKLDTFYSFIATISNSCPRKFFWKTQIRQSVSLLWMLPPSRVTTTSLAWWICMSCSTWHRHLPLHSKLLLIPSSFTLSLYGRNPALLTWAHMT